jgi:hypothetical protein
MLRTSRQRGPTYGPCYGQRRRYPRGYVVVLVTCWTLPVVAGVVVAVIVASRSMGGAG